MNVIHWATVQVSTMPQMLYNKDWVTQQPAQNCGQAQCMPTRHLDWVRQRDGTYVAPKDDDAVSHWCARVRVRARKSQGERASGSTAERHLPRGVAVPHGSPQSPPRAHGPTRAVATRRLSSCSHPTRSSRCPRPKRPLPRRCARRCSKRPPHSRHGTRGCHSLSTILIFRDVQRRHS